MSEAGVDQEENKANAVKTESVKEQLDAITNLLKSFDDRLKLVETSVQSRPRPRPTSTLTEGAELPVGTAEAACSTGTGINDSPTVKGACAADIYKEFEAIKDSVSKIVLPPWLKVNDSPAGVKQENKHALKILSRSARFTETALKLLSTFSKSEDNSYTLTEDDVNALFIILSASSNFLQSEYANIVVKSSFDEETSRLFNNLENNTAAFSDKSLQNIRIAAELAAVSTRSSQRRPSRSSQHLAQGSRFNNWRGRFFQSRNPFPRHPFSGNYNSSSGFGNNNSSSGNCNPNNYNN